jgi:head-tail adaptor
MQRRYDRIVTVQRKTLTESGSGEPIETWADVAFRAYASQLPTPGSERYTNAQEVAEQEVTFTIRFHAIPSASRPLKPTDRIIYPAQNVAAATQSPPAGSVYDILGIEEVGRENDLRVRCVRRADV